MTTSYVLGAPGSGKSSVAEELRRVLPGQVVVDWDAFMEPAGELAGVQIREEPRTWAAYERLVRAVVESVRGHPVVVLGVTTPDELVGWPSGRWILLDCSDDERRRRLERRATRDDVDAAVLDAARYRALGLPVVDSTDTSPEAVALRIAAELAHPAGGGGDGTLPR